MAMILKYENLKRKKKKKIAFFFSLAKNPIHGVGLESNFNSK